MCNLKYMPCSIKLQPIYFPSLISPQFIHLFVLRLLYGNTKTGVLEISCTNSSKKNFFFHQTTCFTFSWLRTLFATGQPFKENESLTLKKKKKKRQTPTVVQYARDCKMLFFVGILIKEKIQEISFIFTECAMDRPGKWVCCRRTEKNAWLLLLFLSSLSHCERHAVILARTTLTESSQVSQLAKSPIIEDHDVEILCLRLFPHQV